jgi:hypothetical protein
MPGLVPGIHALSEVSAKTWMAGTSLDKPGYDGRELSRSNPGKK